jgi:hypothetical protein
MSEETTYIAVPVMEFNIPDIETIPPAPPAEPAPLYCDQKCKFDLLKHISNKRRQQYKITSDKNEFYQLINRMVRSSEHQLQHATNSAGRNTSTFG